MKRLEEINPPLEECVRTMCELFSDVLTAGWNRKMLRATGYSLRSMGKDSLVEVAEDEGLNVESHVQRFVLRLRDQWWFSMFKAEGLPVEPNT